MEDIFNKMQRLAGVPKTETKSKSINENKNTVEDIKKLIRESFLAEKKKKEDETSTEEVDMMSDLTDETENETTDAETTNTETSSEVDSGAKDIQDHLEAALEGAKSIGDEKLIDQIGNTITFLVRSHVVKENETPLMEKKKLGLTFEQILYLVESEYNDYRDGMNDDGEGDEGGSEFEGVTDIEELVNVLDGLGFNGDEAYDFIFTSIINN